MADIITTLHPEGQSKDNLYPNILPKNIPNKAINIDKVNDDLLNLINSGKDGSPSYVGTENEILSLTVNEGLAVATDTGKWYYFNGTNYVEGGIYQAAALSNTNFLELGINNYIDITNDIHFQLGVIISSGIVYNANFVRSDVLQFSKGDELVVSAPNGIRVGVFSDSAGANIVNFISSDTSLNIVIDSRYYYSFSCSLVDEHNIIIRRKSHFLPNGDFIDLITKNEIKQNYTYSVGAILSNGFINTNVTSFAVTGFINFSYDCKLKIKLKDGYNSRMCIYNSPSTSDVYRFIREIEGIHEIDSTKYYRFCFGTNSGTPISLSDEYATISITSNFATLDDTLNLSGKTAYLFGDSLMYGHYQAIGMMDMLASAENILTTKYAINGATVVGGTGNYNLTNQVLAASNITPDYVIFDGSTNDAYESTILGSISDSYEDAFDLSTFAGSFEHLCYTIRNKYLTSKVLYVYPHKMPTRSSLVLTNLHDLTQAICEKWSFTFIDIYNMGDINCNIDSMREAYSYDTLESLTGGNGTHLTGEAYYKWYAPILKIKMLEKK